MKNYKAILMLLISVTVTIWSCSKDEDPEPTDPYEKIAGEWKVDKATLLGLDIPGDGSKLTFQTCTDKPCSGTDYENTGKTTGDFTYEIITSGDNSTLKITDNDVKGGSYDGDWSMTTFTSKKMVIKQESLLGEFVLELSK